MCVMLLSRQKRGEKPTKTIAVAKGRAKEVELVLYRRLRNKAWNQLFYLPYMEGRATNVKHSLTFHIWKVGCRIIKAVLFMLQPH